MENDETKTNPAEMNEKDLPDVRAFEDEFTRSFLQSTEETKPGYYPFVSGTGAYKMDFPAGGIIGEKGYGKNDNDFEGYLIGIANENKTESSIKVDYLSYLKQGQEKVSLEILNTQFEDELNFEEIKQKDRTLYLASFEDDDGVYGYAGLIQNNKENGGLQILYDTECLDNEQTCKEVKSEEKKRMANWMKSIEFIKEKKESE